MHSEVMDLDLHCGSSMLTDPCWTGTGKVPDWTGPDTVRTLSIVLGFLSW
jgi:hypothetical protein